MFDSHDPFGPPKRSKKVPSIFDVPGSTPQKSPRDKRRAFTKTQKNEIWAQQGGKCAKCHNGLDPRTVEYDHRNAWSAGGPTKVKNGAALCANCHKIKTHKSRLKKVEKKPKKNNPFGFGGSGGFGPF